MPAPKRANTAPATAARLAKARERKLTAMAEELRAADYVVINPGGCPSHGLHPHNGMTCLDCPICGLERRINA